MFCAVVEVCTISLAEFTMLCARFVGSITVHCALLVTERDDNAINKIIVLFFMPYLLSLVSKYRLSSSRANRP